MLIMLRRELRQASVRVSVEELMSRKIIDPWVRLSGTTVRGKFVMKLTNRKCGILLRTPHLVIIIALIFFPVVPLLLTSLFVTPTFIQQNLWIIRYRR